MASKTQLLVYLLVAFFFFFLVASPVDAARKLADDYTGLPPFPPSYGTPPAGP
uniref:Uncharacterized protein n=1 Tax=Aegilops tauschii TaxID=37682 RepID=N1R362_AEGTA